MNPKSFFRPKIQIRKIVSRGRCYDHDFRRFFFQFSAKKLAFFFNTNVMINFFQNLAQKRQFFRKTFQRKYF
jgi:hypothetical protein